MAFWYTKGMQEFCISNNEPLLGYVTMLLKNALLSTLCTGKIIFNTSNRRTNQQLSCDMKSKKRNL